jgi:hypothetical protein
VIAGDRARVQTFVRQSTARCFDIFTLELDAWWRRGRAYRVGGKQEGALHLEPRLGGRRFSRIRRWWSKRPRDWRHHGMGAAGALRLYLARHQL